jgi:hypothetical protein
MNYDNPTETTPVQPAVPSEAPASVPPAPWVNATPPSVSRPATPALAAKPRRFALRLGATVGAMKAALQWRVLVLWAGVMLLPTAIVALPFWSTLGGALNHSVHAAELANHLDLVAVADLQFAFKGQGALVPTTVMIAVALTLLLSPFLNGMVATATRAVERPSFRELVAGGVEQYPRMLFMLLWAVVPLGVAFMVFGIADGAADGIAEKAITPSDASHAHMAALVVSLLMVAFAHTSVEAGRAVLALDRRRVSPFKAWWDGLKLVLRQPLATLGSYVILTVAALAVMGLLGVARLHANGAGIGAFWLAMLLTQLIALTVAWLRCARMFALVELARA